MNRHPLARPPAAAASEGAGRPITARPGRARLLGEEPREAARPGR
ncbi:MAG: hypothetical protein U0797_11345 [Gemmataceae bacterium]